MIDRSIIALKVVEKIAKIELRLRNLGQSGIVFPLYVNSNEYVAIVDARAPRQLKSSSFQQEFAANRGIVEAFDGFPPGSRALSLRKEVASLPFCVLGRALVVCDCWVNRIVESVAGLLARGKTDRSVPEELKELNRLLELMACECE